MDAQEILNKQSTSKFLKGADIGEDKSTVVIISSVETIMQKRDEREIPQLVLSFADKEKQLGLNVGNTEVMIKMLGAETDDWPGNKITLYTEWTKTPNGDPVLGVRVKGDSEPTVEDTEF